MTDYLTEQEQIEILKNWVKQYSFVILAGILIAVIGTYGWRFWQTRQLKILSHASEIYDEMLITRAQNNFKKSTLLASQLLSQYPKTVYSSMAALMLARDSVNNKNYAIAATHLTWVLDHSKISSLKQIARIRLARIKIAEHQPQEGLSLLKTLDDSNFNGLVDEARGDAYLSQQNYKLAQQYYHQALQEIPNAEVVRPILQMKYDHLVNSEVTHAI